jgi:predicted CoA-substrate-specific enzyme activase
MRQAACLAAGLDAGSVSVKLAVVSPAPGGRAADRLAHVVYQRHLGRPFETALELLHDALGRFPELRVAFAGAASKILAQWLQAPRVNELAALAEAMRVLHPEVGSIIEMGGEDAKYLLLEQGGVKDFNLNSICAAGTGSFLDQQAERMRLSIEEFGQLALRSAKPARIAGRCSVFAKSDMIHLQQIATPVEDVVAGLCFAVARNVKGAIVRNRPLRPALAFVGGVALNAGVVRAFREVLPCPELFVPPHPALLPAVGAAFKAADGLGAPLDPRLLAAAAEHEAQRRAQARNETRKHPLRHRPAAYAPEVPPNPVPTTHAQPAPAFLGIDIGSISTCLALLDQAGTLLAKRYIRTASRPLEAVRQGLAEIEAELRGLAQAGRRYELRGVGTTGSGRYMIADFFGADTVKNEITAQARGAAALAEPEAQPDTIFEIGGQDSKYILLKDGVILDFEMNKACAAGTGSFLEEQAEKLGISIKDEFASLALRAQAPCGLGERCTVFMENSLLTSLQQGAGKDDLLAGLAYSIVENYIHRVVAGRPIGERVFFQGGTAFNQAVVAAFENHLGRPITVPPHHDVSGAIGMALIAREQANERQESRFRGFEQAQRPYALRSFECASCDNRCEINQVQIQGEERRLYYGGRCEKYDIRRNQPNAPEDLFAFREQALLRAHRAHAALFEQGQPAPRGPMGLPRVFFLHEWLPYYATLLWELGFETRVSDGAQRRVRSRGVRLALADVCFPVKVGLGHAASLLETEQDAPPPLLIPSFVNMAEPDSPYEHAHACPLTQSFPYQVRAALPQARILAPVIQVKHGDKAIFKALLQAFAPFGVGRRELAQAMRKAAEAQAAFTSEIQAKGRAILAEESPTRRLLIVGRPYNALDASMNLDIPKKLATLRVQALPMDFLPLDQERTADHWPEMYWRSGQRILAGLAATRRYPGLSAIYIGSFGCGPDSFLLKYAETALAGSPFLHIEIDEHSADAGVITRCEAFLDSLEMREHARTHAPTPKTSLQSKARPSNGSGKRRLVFIPRMGDQAYGMQAAFEASGADAVVMDETDAETLALGRKHVTGKECFPFAVTTADMLKVALSPGFEPERSAFFMPSGTGPCRFGQYNVMQKRILSEAGFPDTPILSPVQDSRFYKDVGLIGKDFSRIAWKGIVAVELLSRCVQAIRPYERDQGAADELYARWLERLRPRMPGPEDKLAETLAAMRAEFERLPQRRESKPLIGIVGEIFVRTNAFSNENLVRRIEALGGETWLTGIDEWVYYVNWCGWQSAKRRRDVKKLLQIGLTSRVQKRIAHTLERPLRGLAQSVGDPPVERLLANAATHLHPSFRGEAILSLGKAQDMIERGISGLVNAMPFGCMPGAIVASLLRRVTDPAQIPTISIAYDGAPSTSTQLQLETFIEQVRARMEQGSK